MRIGILTLPLHTNYGGILQAYALQTILKRLGHDVFVFDQPFEKYPIAPLKKPFIYTKRFINWYIRGLRNEWIFQEELSFNRDLVERKYTQKFIDQYINRYPIWHLSDIKSDDVDGIIVGSDQIWRMYYFKGLWRSNNTADAFLKFTEGWNIKRVSYAASFGTNTLEIPQKQLDDCINAMALFDGISVREESGIELCRNYLCADAKWLIDPTMLLSLCDYQHLINKASNKKGFLVSYVLDENENVDQIRNQIALEKGLSVKFTNHSFSVHGDRGNVSQPPVEDWLNSFKEADYVINDSFHACVFSILFHKQFTVIGNKDRGLARFESLLGMFGLKDRLIVLPQEYHSLPDIDYDKVDRILKVKREEAISFLLNALK